MKRLIVYDLDGTLVDTLQDITASANHMLRALGRPLVSAEGVRSYVGRGVRELVRQCLGRPDEAEVDRALRIYRDHYGRHLLDTSRLSPGASELLERFRQLGRMQAVLTNKPNPYSTEILAGLGVADRFLQIVGGDDGFPKKPDPASLRALMDRAGAAAGETVFIGDSPVDVETGRRAGVLTVAVTHGLATPAELAAVQADATVGGFAELAALADAQGW
jgi:phosphoglycolate phosphatase